jgi:hypothetical protein
MGPALCVPCPGRSPGIDARVCASSESQSGPVRCFSAQNRPLSSNAAKGLGLADGRGSVRAAAAEDDLYFATKVSDRGDAKLFFSLVRNQLILAFSCAWTLSVIDPQSDPTFFAQTSFDISTIPLALGVLFSAPLVAGGLAISRSESRTWVEINAATNQLALRLFGRNRALAAVAVSSSLLGIITGAAEELRYSRTALNERACLAPTSPGRATCTACIGLIRKQAALHGCSDWMRWPTASEGSAYRSLPTALV